MAVKPRKLRGGRPVWLDSRLPTLPVAALKKDIQVDAAVIGAGISGAMAAQALASLGMSVAVLDKRSPLHGSTMATTALLQYEIDQPLSLMVKKTGADKAIRAWRRSKLALSSLAATTRQLGITCDLTPQQSLYLQGALLSAEGLHAEKAARDMAGLPVAYMPARLLKERYGIHSGAALLSDGDYSAHPVKLAAGFLREAVSNGARIYSPVTFSGISETPRRAHISTAEGPVVTAQLVVMATGYEIADIIPARGQKICSTWALAANITGGKQPKYLPMIWEAADPYIYLRHLNDRKVICGGYDETFSDPAARDALIPLKSRQIMRRLHGLFPALKFELTHAWAGCFGVTPTGLPLLGWLPRHKHVYAIQAFGGNGITFSHMAAEMLRAECADRPDPDAPLFAF